MTECQGCGAWNDRGRTRCVLCGTPLGEIDEWETTDELPPLPPLPDGGLAATMPSWLRDLPARVAPIADRPADVDELAPAPQAPIPKPHPEPVRSLPSAMPPLGAQADPRTFLTDDDFPRWLHLLAAQQATRKPHAPPPVTEPGDSVALAAAAPDAMAMARTVSAPVAAAVDWPQHVAPVLPSSATVPAVEVAVLPSPADEALPDVAAMPPPDQSRRVRSSWETLLLIALFIGLVVAAVWALVVNGVFSPAATP